MKKRLLPVLLALAMVLGMLPLTVFAADAITAATVKVVLPEEDIVASSTAEFPEAEITSITAGGQTKTESSDIAAIATAKITWVEENDTDETEVTAPTKAGTYVGNVVLVAQDGYELDTDNDVTITIIDNDENELEDGIKVTVVAAEFNLSIDSNVTNGTVETNPEAGKVEVGTKVVVTATPSNGYELESITYTPDTTGAQAVTVTEDDDGDYSFVMPEANVEVSATFTEEATKYTVSVSESISGGNVVVDKDEAAEDETVTITVTADEGKKVDEVTYTPDSGSAQTVTADANGKYTFTMPADNVTVSATFAALSTTEHSITVDDAITNGSVTSDKTTATEGTTVTLTVTAATDYVVEAVTMTPDEGTAQTLTANAEGKYTFTMPDADVTVSATFTEDAGTVVPPEDDDDDDVISGTVDDDTLKADETDVEDSVSDQVDAIESGEADEVAITVTGGSVDKTEVPLNTTVLEALETVTKPLTIATPQGGVSVTASTLVSITDTTDDVTFKMECTTDGDVETYEVGFYDSRDNEIEVKDLPSSSKITLTFKTSFSMGDEIVVRCGEEAYRGAVETDDGTVTLEVSHLSTWQITKVAIPTVEYKNADDVASTADAKYYYGKLTINGLTDGHYYLIALNNSNVTVGGELANTCFLMQPSSGSIVIPCQSGLKLVLVDVTNGGDFEIPDEFSAEQVLIGYGTTVESVGVVVDSYRADD